MEDKTEELVETVLDDHGSVVEEAHTVLVEKEPPLVDQTGLDRPRKVYTHIALVLLAVTVMAVSSMVWSAWRGHREGEVIKAWQKEQDKRDHAAWTERRRKEKQERDMK